MRCGLLEAPTTSLGRNFKTGQARGGIVLQGTKGGKSFCAGQTGEKPEVHAWTVGHGGGHTGVFSAPPATVRTAARSLSSQSHLHQGGGLGGQGEEGESMLDERLPCARHTLHPVLKTGPLSRQTFRSASRRPTDTLYRGRNKNGTLEESRWTKLVIL